MERSTHTHTHTHKKKPTGVLFPYVVPFGMKIDGGDEKLFMDSPPWLPPTSGQTPKAGHEPLTSLQSAFGSVLVKHTTVKQFPSHLNFKVKYLHQRNCICLASFGNFVTIFIKCLLGAACL